MKVKANVIPILLIMLMLMQQACVPPPAPGGAIKFEQYLEDNVYLEPDTMTVEYATTESGGEWATLILPNEGSGTIYPVGEITFRYIFKSKGDLNYRFKECLGTTLISLGCQEVTFIGPITLTVKHEGVLSPGAYSLFVRGVDARTQSEDDTRPSFYQATLNVGTISGKDTGQCSSGERCAKRNADGACVCCLPQNCPRCECK